MPDPALVSPASTALSRVEASRRASLEEAIASGLKTFVEVGAALSVIRDEQLYRSTHRSFDAYLTERWGFERANAYRLIDAAPIVKAIAAAPAPKVSPTGDKPGNGHRPVPTHERQVRPLTKLPAAEQVDAWDEAVEAAPAGKVTGKIVEQVVARRIERKERPPGQEPEPSEPPAPWAAFEEEVREIVGEIRGISRRLHTLLKIKDGNCTAKWSNFYSQLGTVGGLNSVARALEDGLPAQASDKAPYFIPARSLKNPITRKGV